MWNFPPSACARATWQLVILAACGLAGLPQVTLATEIRASDFFARAEGQFSQPTQAWFQETQDRLRQEMQHVNAALESQGAEYAQAWKNHFRWNLLEKNLCPLADVNLAELELSRRWLYSNRKGTEYPFFAQLRATTDAYLEAAYTLSQPDLREQYATHVKLAREQAAMLQQDPTDANAAALGQTLGWMERTGQLTEEIAAVRGALSHSNLQLVVSEAFVLRLMAAHDTGVSESVPITDRTESVPTRRFQAPRTVHVRGTAHSTGRITLSLEPNHQVAELCVLYQGVVDSVCRGNAGPLSFTMHTDGPVSATKPVTFGPQGIDVDRTAVAQQVHTRVTSISAESNFVRRVGERRLNEPESRTAMNSRARTKTAELLVNQMDARVAEAIRDIHKEIDQSRNNAGQFAEVIAPVFREGAAPRFEGTASTGDAVNVNVLAQNRSQFGAPTPCPVEFAGSDVQLRLHVSFLNNMLATIMGGKTFTDEYFAKYAKVLQPTLPLDLMVHTRARRWAVIAATPRPFVLSIPETNHFSFTLHFAALELDGQRHEAATTMTVSYELKKNDIGEYYLERIGDLQLDSALTAHQQDFLEKKLAAFFSPILDGSGVMIPDSGAAGSVNLLQLAGVQAEHDWLAIGWGVPREFIDSVRKSRSEATESPSAPLPDTTTLPPPFAVDEELSTYPGVL